MDMVRECVRQLLATASHRGDGTAALKQLWFQPMKCCHNKHDFNPVKLNTWVGVKNFGFTEEQKNIEQGSIKLKELHVCIMRVQKKMAAWRSEEP